MDEVVAAMRGEAAIHESALEAHQARLAVEVGVAITAAGGAGAARRALAARHRVRAHGVAALAALVDPDLSEDVGIRRHAREARADVRDADADLAGRRVELAVPVSKRVKEPSDPDGESTNR